MSNSVEKTQFVSDLDEGFLSPASSRSNDCKSPENKSVFSGKCENTPETLSGSFCSTPCATPNPATAGLAEKQPPSEEVDPSLLAFLDSLRYKNTFLEVGGRSDSFQFVKRANSTPADVLASFSANLASSLKRGGALPTAGRLEPVDEDEDQNVRVADAATASKAAISPQSAALPKPCGPVVSDYSNVVNSNNPSPYSRFNITELASIVSGAVALASQVQAARRQAAFIGAGAPTVALPGTENTSSFLMQRGLSTMAAAPSRMGALEFEPDDPQQQTTVMLRNIPNKYVQSSLLEVISMKGYFGGFDFFYLPVDFKNGCNMGYAFINFRTHELAAQFMNDFKGFQLPAVKSVKVCDVCWARVQGLKRNVEHYRNSPVNDLPNMELRPLIFGPDGNILPFPAPDDHMRRLVSERKTSNAVISTTSAPANINSKSDKTSTSCSNASFDNKNDNQNSSKLFVGGLSAMTTGETLRMYFSQFGFVTDASVVVDKKTVTSRGFGFCTFANPSVAEEVLRQKHWIDGQSVGIRLYSAASAGTATNNATAISINPTTIPPAT